MKIVTVLGTRPEIIRLSLIIKCLDSHCDHVLVHTGQNFDPQLNQIFFDQLNVRKPDYFLNAKGGFGTQVGAILTGVEETLLKEQPDRFLVLGDTNSALSAIVAKRLGIPVYHMEAGNRCYDDRVPEEVNRRLIDHSSDVLMPYTERSRANLLREGIAGERILVTGNPILEVIKHHDDQILMSNVMEQLELEPGNFFLVTMHRAENVDIESRLRKLSNALVMLQRKYQKPVVVSTHPRTRAKLRDFKIEAANDDVRFIEPFSFFDFISLERNAFCVLSDSGTVQEECSIFGVPNVTIRDVTERPETIECGSNILSGADPDSILQCTEISLASKGSWSPPAGYLVENVSDIVTRIVLGFRLGEPGNS
jgi:UDP-N-acetylglucosamine 2-epimerase (non-hydrolysing)